MKTYHQKRQPFRSRPSRHKLPDPAPVLSAIRAAITAAPANNSTNGANYVPENKFDDFPISAALRANIENRGYRTPTPIQDRVIPAILSGRDVIGIANTGTGKTAAFLVPMIEKITRDRNQRVLIITPTRELAIQIGAELGSFSRGLGIRWAMVTGGTSAWRQKQDIKNGAHIVIGTPGRLKDLIREHTLSLSQFRNVILDEADRMVDIGFIADITYFISLLPKERQSLCFSATISGKVSEILFRFVEDPVTVSVKSQDTAKGIIQNLIRTSGGKNKIEHLHDLLNQKEFDKVLIFGRTKWGVEKLTKELVSRGFKAASIHGNKRQSQRQRALTQFKTSEIQVLLATDVASRGLDISGVSHVINYDLPETYDDYVHRIGRTGRANRSGIALTFVD